MSQNDTNKSIMVLKKNYVYFGNLIPHEPQYQTGLFLGLALIPKFDQDIFHDARQPLPFADDSILGFQSQDVFEHIEHQNLPAVFNEIYRCLTPGGIFRLSLPDYNSPLLRNRSVYDSHGKILADLAMGGRVSCKLNQKIIIGYDGPPGDAHLWFPDYGKVCHLILLSDLRKCPTIKFHHGWLDAYDFICEPFEGGIMPVSRTPPVDMRAGGMPISIVVDFIK